MSAIRNDLKLHDVAGQAPDNISINVVKNTRDCVDVPFREQWNVASQDKNWHPRLLNDIVIDAFTRFPIGIDPKDICSQ